MYMLRACIAALLCGYGTFVEAIDLDISSRTSIKSATSEIAYGLMKWYTGNVTNIPSTIGVLPYPYYWWMGGAMWGAMLDYKHYTNDSTYDNTVIQALLSQVGPNNDYMVPLYATSEGNDDQAFWGLATMTAAEISLTPPSTFNSSIPSWLRLTENLWNTQAARWNTSTCGGGLKWQIFTFNSGYNYKNSISNAAFFHLSARLYRYTGNQTYLTWAQRSWDWSQNIGLIAHPGADDDGDPTGLAVYDGATDDPTNCSTINKIQWTYNSGTFMYGAAVLYNMSTDTTSQTLWAGRVSALLRNTEIIFFSRFANATNVMVESACEPPATCNNDMYSFKAYLSRFMWKTTKMAPFTTPNITTLLQTSAVKAAGSCTVGNTGDGGKGGNGTICGSKWYTAGYNGITGPGEMLSALETIQGLLVNDTAAPGTSASVTSSSSSSSSTSTSATPSATVASSSSRAWAAKAVRTLSPVALGMGVGAAIVL